MNVPECVAAQMTDDAQSNRWIHCEMAYLQYPDAYLIEELEKLRKFHSHFT